MVTRGLVQRGLVVLLVGVLLLVCAGVGLLQSMPWGLTFRLTATVDPGEATRVASLRPAATPTIPPFEYRQATVAWAEQIDSALKLLHEPCWRGVIANCARALDFFTAVTAEPERLLRNTAPPADCRSLWAAYESLLNQLPPYRSQLGDALATGDSVQVAATDQQRYSAWEALWLRSADLLYNPCNQGGRGAAHPPAPVGAQ